MHELAQAHGWSEAAVLAISAPRRQGIRDDPGMSDALTRLILRAWGVPPAGTAEPLLASRHEATIGYAWGAAEALAAEAIAMQIDPIGRRADGPGPLPAYPDPLPPRIQTAEARGRAMARTGQTSPAIVPIGETAPAKSELAEGELGHAADNSGRVSPIRRSAGSTGRSSMVRAGRRVRSASIADTDINGRAWPQSAGCRA